MKKLDASSLAKAEEALVEEVKELYKKYKPRPITDGIVDIKKYLRSKYRICWVLKEPYDKKEIKGGWSLTNDYLAKDHPDIPKLKTWQGVIYVTYSIFNDFISYRDMDYISDDPAMCEVLKEIAVINVGKMPGLTSSNDEDLAAKYEMWKPILHRQLETYDPQIIIFGNTLQYFQKDLGIKDEELKNKNCVTYTVKNNKIYANAYHPSRPPMPREDYVDGLAGIIKKHIGEIS